MNVALMDKVPRTAPESLSRSRASEDIRMQVRAIVGTAFMARQGNERRSSHRYPYPHMVYLTPVADDGVTSDGESIAVVGKQLSERGLDFYHSELLPHRRVIASLVAANGRPVSFLLDLSRCRFVGGGWYENGGRFLQVVESPLAASQAASAIRR